MKKIFTMLLITLTLGLNAQALKLKAGSVLKYKITNGAESYNLTVTIKSWDADRSIDYEVTAPKAATGNIILGQACLDNATGLNNDFAGGPMSMSTESCVWISKAVYNSLKRDFQARLSSKGQVFTLLNNYEDEYKVTVDGKPSVLNIIYAEEQSGKPYKYWILNEESNPLLVKLIDWGLTIELQEITQ
jgi:hypothetical protein